MGTRSTVKFYDEYNPELPVLCVYHQFDGYLEGKGKDLADFIKSKTMINGIGCGQNMAGGFANGIGCLAAQYVKEFKVKTGGLYLTNSEDSQDYDYQVYFKDGVFKIKVDDFEGTPDELLELIKKEAEQD